MSLSSNAFDVLHQAVNLYFSLDTEAQKKIATGQQWFWNPIFLSEASARVASLPVCTMCDADRLSLCMREVIVLMVLNRMSLEAAINHYLKKYNL